MKTFTTTEPATGITRVITEFYLGDYEDLSRNESTFKAVMIKVLEKISTAIADEIEPKIRDYVISRIDIQKLIDEAMRQKVSDILFPKETSSVR